MKLPPFAVIGSFLLLGGSFVSGQVTESDELPEPKTPVVEFSPDSVLERSGAKIDAPRHELEGEPIKRGPIHEAFANPLQLTPEAPPARRQPPPEPVEEIPPPAGPNETRLTWIPGYWSWDEQRSEYVWVSGVWRKPPKGRTWVPGQWETDGEASVWTPGFWQKEQEASPPVDVLPLPPESLEEGPTGEPPSKDHFWIPGTWKQNGDGEYVWRPGFWSKSQANWIWIPEHYVWQPGGCAHVPGYWDYPWERRGTLYAPCTFGPGRLTGNVYYRPKRVLSSSLWLAHLWVGPSNLTYYYGDYGTIAGYSPWYRYYGTHARYYDPFYTYYRWRFPSMYGIGLYGYLDGLHTYYRGGVGHYPSVSFYSTSDWHRRRPNGYRSVYGDVRKLYGRADRHRLGLSHSPIYPRNTLDRRALDRSSERGQNRDIEAFRRNLGRAAERNRGRLRQDSLGYPGQPRSLRSLPSGASSPSRRSGPNSTLPGFRNVPSRSPSQRASPGFRNVPSRSPRRTSMRPSAEEGRQSFARESRSTARDRNITSTLNQVRAASRRSRADSRSPGKTSSPRASARSSQSSSARQPAKVRARRNRPGDDSRKKRSAA